MESGGRFLFDNSGLHDNMLFLGNNDHVFQGSTRSIMVSMEDDNTMKKRPFLYSLSADMYDEEYYDDQLAPEKKRRLTPEQVNMLEKSFEAENKLEPERKTQLAKKLGLQPRQVAVWFQNRRARWKTKQLERDYDILKSSYDALLASHDSVVKENEKLKSEFASLSEKIQAKEPAGLAMSGQIPDIPPANPSPTASKKVEDRLSSGSGGSAVVDEDSPQLVDSGNSCIPSEVYPGCVAPPIEGMNSEDDGSDDGHSYFPDVYAAVAGQQQNDDEGEPLGWWVWS